MTNSIPQQLQAIEEMIQRRMANTGETRQQAAAHRYLPVLKNEL